MALRVRAEWNGFSGAPGLSTFVFRTDSGSAESNANLVRESFQLISGVLKNGWTVQVLPEVQEFDPATGDLTGIQIIDTPDPVLGSSPGQQFAAGVGARVRWLTDAIVNGRRLYGSTYIVPMTSNWYDGDGTIAAEALTVLQAFASNLEGGGGVADDEFAVWSPTGGIVADVTGYIVPDRVSWLRSRRT